MAKRCWKSKKYPTSYAQRLTILNHTLNQISHQRFKTILKIFAL